MSAIAESAIVVTGSPRRAWQTWRWLALLLCLPSLIPLLSALSALWQPVPEVREHLWQVVLPQASLATLWLLLGVAVGTSIIGTTLAALIALCEFPGRGFFRWAMILPMALPGYVMAVAFIGLFDYSGPMASTLRSWGVMALPEIRSLPGMIMVMTLALYPYVYLVAHDAFASQGMRALEAARSLGMSPIRAFFRASLPMARPWITGGVALTLMEAAADFGTPVAFNIDTYSVAIYKAWVSLRSTTAALQIAAVLLIMIFVLTVLEALSRHRQSFAVTGSANSHRLALGTRGWLAALFCAVILLLALALPVAKLASDAWQNLAALDARYFRLLQHSLFLAAGAAVLTVAAALVMALASHQRRDLSALLIARIATLGYGLPGAVLAIGLYVPVARLSTWLSETSGMTIALEGGIALLLIGYGVRFLAVAFAPLSSGLLRIKPSMLEAARSLGVTGARQLRQVHWPLLRGALTTAAVLVFVDVMKEMPITLMMRPFGWDTLATRVFEFSNEGQWQQAALPALTILLIGLLPVWLLTRRGDHAA